MLILANDMRFSLRYPQNHRTGCVKMDELTVRILIDTKQRSYGEKIAARLQETEVHAVVCTRECLASYGDDTPSYEDYKILLIDNETIDIHTLTHSRMRIIVLTEEENPDSYVIQKNGILFVSKALGMDNICGIIQIYVYTDQQQMVEKAATQFIRNMGIQSHMSGYNYLRTAVVCAVEKPELLESMTKKLYSTVGKIHHVPRQSAERAIRNAIDSAYDRTPAQMQKYFHYPVGKPSSSELISLIVDDIRMGIL